MKISGLTITTAVAMYAAAPPAKALTLTMACEGYNVVFSPGSLMSHAPKKDRDYPITKVDVQNDRIVVTGVTKYGKITAFFSNDGHPSIVWTNGKDVLLNQCASQAAAPATQQPLQTGHTERVLPASPVVYDTKTADCMRAIDQSKESERRLCTEPAPTLTVDADDFPIQDVETVCRRVNAPSAINNRVGPPIQAAMNVCIGFVQPYYNSAKRYWNGASYEDRKACLSKAGDGGSYGFYTHLDQCFEAKVDEINRNRPHHFNAW